jgi:hypothetical protein
MHFLTASGVGERNVVELSSYLPTFERSATPYVDVVDFYPLAADGVGPRNVVE